MKCFVKEYGKLLFQVLMLFSLLSSCKKKEFSHVNKQQTENLYFHKGCESVEDLLIKIDKNESGFSRNKTLESSNVAIGIVSGVFIKDDKCLNKILAHAKDFSDETKIIIFTSLFRADLSDLARKFAVEYFPDYSITAIKGNDVVGIKRIIPGSDPLINDLLVGAYYATRDNIYLGRMLYNFKTEKKEKARDAIRVALVSGKYGVSLSPKNHSSKMLEAAKRKYNSKKDPKSILRFMTMSSALWVLNSISKSDDDMKKYLNSFFLDEELRSVFLSEQIYLSLYMKALIPKLNSVESPDSEMVLNQALVKKNKKLISDYEGLRDLNKSYLKQGML